MCYHKQTMGAKAAMVREKHQAGCGQRQGRERVRGIPTQGAPTGDQAGLRHETAAPRIDSEPWWPSPMASAAICQCLPKAGVVDAAYRMWALQPHSTLFKTLDTRLEGS